MAAHPHTAAPPAATDLRQRAARARDAAGRFIKHVPPVEPPAEAKTPATSAPDEAPSRVEIKPPHVSEVVDLTTATIDELEAVMRTADRLCMAAFRESWSFECQKNEGDLPAAPNIAGILMVWVGKLLSQASIKACEEIGRRTPADAIERERWLCVRAAPAIESSEPDTIEAFARELLAHAAAEREGR